MIPEISAILVNYNAGQELVGALRSIEAECREIAWEALVVDNASSDGSVAAVDGFPHTTLICNSGNVGFGRAVNQAVNASKAPLLLLMNPDCELKPGAIATLRVVLASLPSCAVVGPRILDPDGAVQGSARGDPDMLTGLFGRTGALRVLMPFLPVARRNVVVEVGRAPLDARGKPGKFAKTSVQSQVDLLTPYTELLRDPKAPNRACSKRRTWAGGSSGSPARHPARGRDNAGPARGGK